MSHVAMRFEHSGDHRDAGEIFQKRQDNLQIILRGYTIYCWLYNIMRAVIRLR